MNSKACIPSSRFKRLATTVILTIKLILMIAYSNFVAAAPLKIVVDEYPPLISSKLPEGGFAAALATKVLNEAGYKTELTYIDFVKGLKGLQTGQYDIMPAIHDHEERKKYIRFSKPFISSQLVLVSTRSNFTKLERSKELEISRELELTGKSLAYYGALDSAPKVQEADLRKVKNAKECFDLIEDGTVDFAIVDLLDFRVKQRKQSTNAKELAIVKILSKESYHIGISRKTQDSAVIIRKIDKHIDKMKKSGELEIRIFDYLTSLEQFY